MRTITEHLRSNVVGYVALFFALGLGSAWAASELSKNEVKSRHIAKNQVKRSDLAPKAVGSREVLDGSLLKEDFDQGQLIPGPRGATGPQGPAGVSGHQFVYAESANDSQAGKSALAACPDGKVVLGAGALINGVGGNAANTQIALTGVVPAASGVVVAEAHEIAPGYAGNWSVQARAICAYVE